MIREREKSLYVLYLIGTGKLGSSQSESASVSVFFFLGRCIIQSVVYVGDYSSCSLIYVYVHMCIVVGWLEPRLALEPAEE